jgi:hypothetical protein
LDFRNIFGDIGTLLTSEKNALLTPLETGRKVKDNVGRGLAERNEKRKKGKKLEAGERNSQ